MLPQSIDIRITRKCNLNCSFCFGTKCLDNELCISDWEFLLARFKSHGVKIEYGIDVKNVIIDSILVERDGIAPHYDRMKKILRNNPLDIVEVFCPLDICRQRNIDRGDRYEKQSEEQAELMATDIQYSLRVDTSKLCPDECADAILKALF